jgi:Rnl2 family RNA ligase
MIDPKANDPRYKKYTSITNHYQGGEIARWVNHFPHLPVSKFVVEEKLDGSNMGVHITSTEITYSSRRKILEDTDGFNEYQRIFAKYDEHLTKLQKYLIDNNHSNIRVYGELFGKVFTRVNNGNANDFRAFDILIDNKMLPKVKSYALLEELDIKNWWVPVLGIFDTFQEAYDYNIDIDTNIVIGEQTEHGCKKIEGVVISPYEEVFKYDTPDDGESIFKIKKKSEKFTDKANTKKEYVPFEGSDEYNRLHNIWNGMINENRLLDLFSKEGKIESPKQIGKYIPLMLKDVKEDFFKEHKDAFILLTDAEKKKVIGSTAGTLLPLLQAHL